MAFWSLLTFTALSIASHAFPSQSNDRAKVAESLCAQLKDAEAVLAAREAVLETAQAQLENATNTSTAAVNDVAKSEFTFNAVANAIAETVTNRKGVVGRIRALADQIQDLETLVDQATRKKDAAVAAQQRHLQELNQALADEYKTRVRDAENAIRAVLDRDTRKEVGVSADAVIACRTPEAIEALLDEKDKGYFGFGFPLPNRRDARMLAELVASMAPPDDIGEQHAHIPDSITEAIDVARAELGEVEGQLTAAKNDVEKQNRNLAEAEDALELLQSAQQWAFKELNMARDKDAKARVAFENADLAVSVARDAVERARVTVDDTKKRHDAAVEQFEAYQSTWSSKNRGALTATSTLGALAVLSLSKTLAASSLASSVLFAERQPVVPKTQTTLAKQLTVATASIVGTAAAGSMLYDMVTGRSGMRNALEKTATRATGLLGFGTRTSSPAPKPPKVTTRNMAVIWSLIGGGAALVFAAGAVSFIVFRRRQMTLLTQFYA